MRMTYRIEGLSGLDAALGELPKATAKGVLRRVGIKALQPVAEAARQLAPDDPTTGAPDLRTSIKVGTKLTRRQARQNTRRQDRSTVEVFAGANNPAAVPQEFGTPLHGPHPFMRPAWEQTKDQVLNIVATELGGEIEKTATRRAARLARQAAV